MSMTGLEVFDETVQQTNIRLMLLRGIYYEGWKPSTVPTKERTKDEFFQKISDELQDIRPINVQAAAEAVFRALTRHVTEGEIEDVKAVLPASIREIWPH